MKGVKHFLMKLSRSVLHRSNTFALEGGISFGPGRDPKGSFYTNPRLSIYWHQPEAVVPREKGSVSTGLLKGLLLKVGTVRLSA